MACTPVLTGGAPRGGCSLPHHELPRGVASLAILILAPQGELEPTAVPAEILLMRAFPDPISYLYPQSFCEGNPRP